MPAGAQPDLGDLRLRDRLLQRAHLPHTSGFCLDGPSALVRTDRHRARRLCRVVDAEDELPPGAAFMAWYGQRAESSRTSAWPTRSELGQRRSVERGVEVTGEGREVGGTRAEGDVAVRPHEV